MVQFKIITDSQYVKAFLHIVFYDFFVISQGRQWYKLTNRRTDIPTYRLCISLIFFYKQSLASKNLVNGISHNRSLKLFLLKWLYQFSIPGIAWQ